MEDSNSTIYGAILWLSIIFGAIIGIVVGASVSFAIGDLLINSAGGGVVGAVIGLVAYVAFSQLSASSSGASELDA